MFWSGYFVRSSRLRVRSWWRNARKMSWWIFSHNKKPSPSLELICTVLSIRRKLDCKFIEFDRVRQWGINSLGFKASWFYCKFTIHFSRLIHTQSKNPTIDLKIGYNYMVYRWVFLMIIFLEWAIVLRKVGVELLCLTVNFWKYSGNTRHNYYEICF